MIKAEIVGDSLSPQGHRITSFLLTYPRIIHSELMTHRMFSRNSASSRAIPFKRMVESVMENPFVPLAWQKSHKGMQGTEYFSEPENINYAVSTWLDARDAAVKQAEYLNELGATKQLCNRLLEPFMWHTTLVTATEFENFFNLRCPSYLLQGVNNNKSFRSRQEILKRFSHNDSFSEKLNNFTIVDWLKVNQSQAEIHLSLLAEAMWDAYNESIPKQLQAGDWHIPFEDKIDLKQLEKVTEWETFPLTADYGDRLIKEKTERNLEKLKTNRIKVSTGMCARTSYTTVGTEKEVSYETFISIHDKMVKANPMHSSPFEHCARTMSEDEYKMHYNGIQTIAPDKTRIPSRSNEGWCKNFRGFIQYRELLERAHSIKEKLDFYEKQEDRVH